jgi:hypothetical protein
MLQMRRQEPYLGFKVQKVPRQPDEAEEPDAWSQEVILYFVLHVGEDDKTHFELYPQKWIRPLQKCQCCLTARLPALIERSNNRSHSKQPNIMNDFMAVVRLEKDKLEGYITRVEKEMPRSSCQTAIITRPSRQNQNNQCLHFE